MIFYTYIHRDRNVSGVEGIFYVGKGTEGRAWQRTHRRRSQQWLDRVAVSGGFITEIVQYWPTEEEAFDHERELIADFRAQGAQLVNLTDGGDGVRLIPELIARRTATLNATNQRPEIKLKRSLAMRLAAKDPIFSRKRNEAIRASCRDPEILERKRAAIERVRRDPLVQDKQRQAKLRISKDPAYREKKRRISLENGNQPPTYRGADHPMARILVCKETGEQFLTVRFAIAWLKSCGHQKASPSALVACCRRRQKSAYRFHWEYVL